MSVTEPDLDRKKRILRLAVEEYEFSWAPEYEKTAMTSRAGAKGTLDFDYDSPERDVEVCPDGAWVSCRVWVPNSWIDTNS